MDPDESKLVGRLRDLDRTTPFDAAAFAKRLIAKRARRRRQRKIGIVAGCAIVLLLGSRYQFPQEFFWREESNTVVSGEPLLVDTSKRAESPLNDNSHAQDLTEKFARIAKTRAEISSLKSERIAQMLVIYRAEASDTIAVPDVNSW